MKLFVQERLKQIEREGYTLSFDEIFNRGFNIWKKVTLPMAGAFFLLFIPIAILFMLFAPFLYGMPFSEIIEVGKNNPQLFSVMAEDPMFRLRSLLFNLLITLFLSPFGAGFVRMCKEADFTGRAGFPNLFYYFRMPFLTNLLIVSLLISIVSLGASFGLQELGMAGNILNYVVMAVIHTLTIFAVSLVIFGDAGPLEAIGTSIKLASKNFFMVLGMALVGGIIGILGVFVCCVGLFFTLSFVYMVNYILYRQAIGFEEMQEENTAPELPGSEGGTFI
ncbi:MAG: hypothetical protein IBJ09_05840 [Bacteroidia bacterium]|nr:hypothetical protein [Bacteroidia bacterium]